MSKLTKVSLVFLNLFLNCSNVDLLSGSKLINLSIKELMANFAQFSALNSAEYLGLSCSSMLPIALAIEAKAATALVPVPVSLLNVRRSLFPSVVTDNFLSFSPRIVAKVWAASLILALLSGVLSRIARTRVSSSIFGKALTKRPARAFLLASVRTLAVSCGLSSVLSFAISDGSNNKWLLRPSNIFVQITVPTLISITIWFLSLSFNV